MAAGWWAAVGGLGIARDVALGGAAVARHANDSTAIAYVDTHLLFFRVASWLVYHSSRSCSCR